MKSTKPLIKLGARLTNNNYHLFMDKDMNGPNKALFNTTVYRRKGSYRFKTPFSEPYPLQKRSLFAKNILSRDSYIKRKAKSVIS